MNEKRGENKYQYNKNEVKVKIEWAFMLLLSIEHFDNRLIIMKTYYYNRSDMSTKI